MTNDCQTACDRFHRDGYVVIEAAIDAERCQDLIAAIDAEVAVYPSEWRTRWLRSQMHFRSQAILSLLDCEPVVTIADELLAFEPGEVPDLPRDQWPRCHVLNATSMVTRPGDPGHGWHVDGQLTMPRDADIPWDDRIQFPVTILTAMYYLTDTGIDAGPTVLVPGSHKSGRKPELDAVAPTYAGRGAETIVVKAGDCLMFHNQIWHHATEHRVTERRYVQQVHYGAPFIAPAYWPLPNGQVPVEFLDSMKPRQRRLLGMHPCTSQYC